VQAAPRTSQRGHHPARWGPKTAGDDGGSAGVRFQAFSFFFDGALRRPSARAFLSPAGRPKIPLAENGEAPAGSSQRDDPTSATPLPARVAEIEAGQALGGSHFAWGGDEP